MVNNIKENRVKRPASSINSSTLARKSQGPKFTANSRRGYNNIGIDRNIHPTKKPSKLKKHISEEQARKNVKSLTIDLYSEKGHTRKKSKLKEPTKFRDSKESSLKNYTKKYPEKAPATKLTQPKKSYPSMYKMHDVVQSYKSKVEKTRNSNLSRMVNDTMEDFENESFPSERPN